jgi:hypothetical protein
MHSLPFKIIPGKKLTRWELGEDKTVLSECILFIQCHGYVILLFQRERMLNIFLIYFVLQIFRYCYV